MLRQQATSWYTPWNAFPTSLPPSIEVQIFFQEAVQIFLETIRAVTAGRIIAKHTFTHAHIYSRSQGSWVNIRHQLRQDNYTRTGCFFLSHRGTRISRFTHEMEMLTDIWYDCVGEKKKKKKKLFLRISRMIWIVMDFFFFFFKLRNKEHFPKSIVKIKIWIDQRDLLVGT